MIFIAHTSIEVDVSAVRCIPTIQALDLQLLYSWAITNQFQCFPPLYVRRFKLEAIKLRLYLKLLETRNVAHLLKQMKTIPVVLYNDFLCQTNRQTPAHTLTPLIAPILCPSVLIAMFWEVRMCGKIVWPIWTPWELVYTHRGWVSANTEGMHSQGGRCATNTRSTLVCEVA